MNVPDLLVRRRSAFVLWRPAVVDPVPRLVIGTLVGGVLTDVRVLDLAQMPGQPGLWARAADECGLTEGVVQHYWFEVTDTRPDGPGGVVRVTDPAAGSVDWSLCSDPLPAPYTADDRWPAAVVVLRDGLLVECDPGGEIADWAGDPGGRGLATNDTMVIYKLPTRWARAGVDDGVVIGTGTFSDVLALVVTEAAAPGFVGVAALSSPTAYLERLGVTSLELTPIADSWQVDEWGYGTSNYLAPDYDLGRPVGATSSTANRDLATLVAGCHGAGLRFGYDAVMGFGQRDPYREIAFLDFHVWFGHGDPEQADRNGWGGDLWKYGFATPGYDPVTGDQVIVFPARSHLLCHLARWMLDQRVDSIRVDSVNTIGSYDFVGAFTAAARSLARSRGTTDDRFLVYGEELADPVAALVGDHRLDGLQNERFKEKVRCAILGTVRDAPDFASMVRDLVDCRRLGYSDGAQAVNYVTSHDVGGIGNERLFNYLNNNGVPFTEGRIKLAFVCLLTAVGIPLILAGEEFADQHDLPHDDVRGKQVDPVNWDRLEDPWREEVFEYVARLVRLRTGASALAVNDVAFVHDDFTDGRRVMAWQRGGRGQDPVVVVANFSDWASDPGSDYVIDGWPRTPPGRSWREVTQDRAVPADWVGREPLFAWEAKVYTLA